jgi:N-acetyl-anhydromuramyl-L-alanine amidase AmpD
MALPKLVEKLSPNFSERGSKVDILVLHDCEGGYAASINWFLMERSQVSAHYVVNDDGSEATLMVPLDKKAWAVCAFNSRSVSVEMAGYESKGYNPALLSAAATMFAYLASYLHIPIRHARGGIGPGICSHYDLGAAGGNHSDPSRDPAFMDTFIAAVQAEYNKHDFPAHWEPDASAKPCSLTPPAPDAAGKAALAASLDLTKIDGQKQALIMLGYNLGPTGANGPMNAITESTIKAFQSKSGLVADGIVGPLTQAAILKALA